MVRETAAEDRVRFPSIRGGRAVCRRCARSRPRNESNHSQARSRDAHARDEHIAIPSRCGCARVAITRFLCALGVLGASARENDNARHWTDRNFVGKASLPGIARLIVCSGGGRRELLADGLFRGAGDRSTVAVAAGLLASLTWDSPAGPSMVVASALLFVAAVSVAPARA